MEFDISKDYGSNYYKIIRIPRDRIDYLSINNNFRAIKLHGIYKIDAISSESEAPELDFIAADNQSIGSDNYILRKNLTTNIYYCIQSVDKENEVKFLKWNKIDYGRYSGLDLIKIDSNQCLNSDEYSFYLEYDLISYSVQIKNKASDLSISV
jgi:hypothetical protein